MDGWRACRLLRGVRRCGVTRSKVKNRQKRKMGKSCQLLRKVRGFAAATPSKTVSCTPLRVCDGSVSFACTLVDDVIDRRRPQLRQRASLLLLHHPVLTSSSCHHVCTATHCPLAVACTTPVRERMRSLGSQQLLCRSYRSRCLSTEHCTGLFRGVDASV